MSKDDLSDLEMIALEEINCCSCGIRFAIPKTLMNIRRNDHELFYCPNGHSQLFKTKKDDSNKELEELRRKERDARNALVAERVAHEQTKREKSRWWKE